MYTFIILLMFFCSIIMSGCQKDNDNSSSLPPNEEITTPPAPNPDIKHHPQNIILLIGDGMGLTQVTSGYIAQQDELALSRFKDIGIVKTFAGNNIITDSAAGATAFATGEKTYREALSVNTDTVPLPTILEIAEQNNLATGLIATSSLTHATPAAFIAHQPNRHRPYAIAEDYLRTPVDIMMGGGRQYFEKRKDGKNLIDSLEANQYNVVNEISNARQPSLPIACFIADKHPSPVHKGRGNFLAQATETALQKLDQNKKGFFLMVEGSQIDWGGHENNTEYITSEMKDFNKAVEVAYNFAQHDSNTLVIVTSDHECGGFAINGGSYNKNKIKGAFTTDYHTATFVPLYAFGPGSHIFRGTQDNTAIFHKMKAAFDF